MQVGLLVHDGTDTRAPAQVPTFPLRGGCVAAKKAWLRRRIPEGLVFRKLDVRGKVFIEYAPSEVAWRPIVAPGWMTIHCLWVSGRYAKQGYAPRLDPAAAAPRFAKAVHEGPPSGDGFVARYTDQRPFNRHWAQQMADDLVAEGHEARVERITTRKAAQAVASPLGTFGLEQGGELVSHALTTTAGVKRLLAKR